MNGSVNVPDASAADLAKVRQVAEAAQADAAAALQAVEAGGAGGGGCVLKITFASEFQGQAYTVSGGGENYTGTVPEGLVAEVTVKNCNTEYTITSTTAGGDQYDTTVTTGAYFGQYTASLTTFTATLTVTAVASAEVTATSDAATYTATADSTGKAVITLKKAGTYTVRGTYSGASSNSATVSATTSGGSYTATVKFITLTVTVDSGSAITVANGSTTLTKTGTGSDLFYLPNTGTWTVTATLNGQTTSESVSCTAYQAYTIALSYVSATLANNTWAVIKEVSDAGQAANYWDVGDTKTITINGTVGGTTFSNLSIDVFIIGINHNSTKEGANRIHFQIGKISGKLVGLIDSGYGTNTASSTAFNMNSTSTNSGGWNASLMRKTILGNSGTPASPPANSLLAALPADLRAVMKSVTKYSDNTGGGNNTASYVTATTDYLFLLAEYEYQGARTYANSAEQNYQAQYDYYKAGNSKVHYRHSSTGTTAYAWCRSVYASYTSIFCLVGTSGEAGNHTAYYSWALAPGFCV